MAFNTLTAKKLLDFCEAITKPKRSIRPAVARISMRNSPFIPTKKTGTRIFFKNNPLYDSECLVSHNDKGDIVVAFRASETEGLFNRNGVFRDWVTTDFDAQPIRYPLDPGPLLSLAKGRWVHRGFWNAYDLVRAEIQDAVSDFLREHRKDKVRIFTTGFSLGGALAIHAGTDLGSRFRKEDVRTYSFAAPRVGNNDFNDLFEQSTKEAYMVVYNGDPVPRTPPAGPNVRLGNKRYQTPSELVFINTRFERKSSFPKIKISMNFREHSQDVYGDALEALD